ncbi:MAG: leucine-rich repeat domain-containing protein [Bacteroidaceae bacterium]|nr:leucine-rich repeat domain-containing protein [Bacteroidaceae bacterium]
MMKQLVLSALMLLFCICGFAYDFEVGGICYNRNTATQTVSVTHHSVLGMGYSGVTIIPDEVVCDGVAYSVTSIGYEAFSGCGNLTSVTIPNSVTSIDDFAFSGCSGLTSVVIPNSVTEIGKFVFSACSGLTSVTISNNVTSIGGYAFRGCSSLASVTIPNSVTSIGYGAFSGCSSLVSATIPNSVISIGYEAFAGCRGLTSVVLSNSVTSIGSEAFSGCSGLTSMTIPNSVISIGYEAFWGCSSLTSVTIGSGVTSIGDGAFDKCDNLETVVSLIQRVFDTNSDVFTRTAYINCTLYVPAGTARKYRVAEGWKEFYQIEDGIPAGIEDVCIDSSEREPEVGIARYSMNGQVIAAPQKGVNILRMSDGSVKKVFVK